MKLNEKANTLTEMERDVLAHCNVESGTYKQEAWIVENYTIAKGRQFSAVCSSLAKKGLIQPRSYFDRNDEYYVELTRKGLTFITEEEYKDVIDEFEDDELLVTNFDAWKKKHGFTD